VGHECQQCRDLGETHDRAMEEYISFVDRQSRLFRLGQARAARDLDATLDRWKTKRIAAINALLAHQSSHDPNRESKVESRNAPNK